MRTFHTVFFDGHKHDFGHTTQTIKCHFLVFHTLLNYPQLLPDRGPISSVHYCHHLQHTGQQKSIWQIWWESITPFYSCAMFVKMASCSLSHNDNTGAHFGDGGRESMPELKLNICYLIGNFWKVFSYHSLSEKGIVPSYRRMDTSNKTVLASTGSTRPGEWKRFY